MAGNLRVAVRTDASAQIGMGHVMRCLSLATELRGMGAEVEFITRDLPGNPAAYIRERGFQASLLISGENESKTEEEPDRWLSVPWETDARQTLENCISQGTDGEERESTCVPIPKFSSSNSSLQIPTHSNRSASGSGAGPYVNWFT